jgi:cobalt/nickel transport system permease protein
MKKRLISFALALVAAALCSGWCLDVHAAKWSGVDETVVEKFAEAAGRPPVEPLINTDQGDLLLFVFLVAGAAGGFVGGYYFRKLFHERRDGELTKDHA